MKKATQKTGPVNLGTKRTCPKCATKFYDFAKEEIVCPKCSTTVDPNAITPVLNLKPEPKKAAKKEVEPEVEVVATETDGIESLEELEDDEDVGVDVDEDREDEF